MKQRSEFVSYCNEDSPQKASKERTKKSKFDPQNFGLFVFKPIHSRFRESFYSMPFQKRLDILEKNIILANEHHQQHRNTHSNFKSMLVGPEYLFKKHHKKGCKQYYSERKKDRYVHTLSELSQHTEIIIAPGTICWKEKTNKDTYYHNEIYFFYKGKVINYNKTYPHPLDFKYIENKAAYESEKKYFKTGATDSPILKLNGISIGVEICLDNAYKHLNSKVNPNQYIAKQKKNRDKKIDLHLLVADGIKKPNLIAQSGLLFFKVERTSKYKTKIGTIFSEHSSTPYLKETPPVSLNKTLIYYGASNSRSGYKT